MTHLLPLEVVELDLHLGEELLGTVPLRLQLLDGERLVLDDSLVTAYMTASDSLPGW